MKIKSVAIIFLVLTLLLVACTNQTASAGTLEGKVTVGPLMPVEQAGVTPPAPPAEVFTSRGIEIRQKDDADVYKTVHFNADGTYSIFLHEGTYTVRLISSGIDRATELPASVKITAGEATQLNITIDTGIR